MPTLEQRLHQRLVDLLVLPATGDRAAKVDVHRQAFLQWGMKWLTRIVSCASLDRSKERVITKP
jgi:hypothetical protein